jgi:hypothetical protein
MDRQVLVVMVTTITGSLFLLVPKSFFVLNGIGYVKPARIMMIVLGLLSLGYGVILLSMAG